MLLLHYTIFMKIIKIIPMNSRLIIDDYSLIPQIKINMVSKYCQKYSTLYLLKAKVQVVRNCCAPNESQTSCNK